MHERSDLGGTPPASMVEVAGGVFAWVQPDGGWFVNTCGLVRGGGPVVSVDTCATEQRTRAYLHAVEQVAGKPPDVVVNTHHHGDHTNGNCLAAGATLVGHANCRSEMEGAGIGVPDGLFEPVEWGALELAPPFCTFEQRLDLHLHDRRVQLLHLTTAAHTTNDVVVWLPDDEVLFAGDLVLNGATPFAVMGSIAGSLEALDRIAELGPTVIVPGHGPPAGMEALDTCGRYLRWVQQEAGGAKAAGATALEAARQLDLGEFSELGEPERLVANVHRAYAELDGVAPGAPIDYAAAFGDMVTLNGGRPLRCRA